MQGVPVASRTRNKLLSPSWCTRRTTTTDYLRSRLPPLAGRVWFAPTRKVGGYGTAPRLPPTPAPRPITSSTDDSRAIPHHALFCPTKRFCSAKVTMDAAPPPNYAVSLWLPSEIKNLPHGATAKAPTTPSPMATSNGSNPKIWNPTSNGTLATSRHKTRLYASRTGCHHRHASGSLAVGDECSTRSSSDSFFKVCLPIEPQNNGLGISAVRARLRRTFSYRPCLVNYRMGRRHFTLYQIHATTPMPTYPKFFPTINGLFL